ncbi:7-cyano-7-deazaguanine synthase QueC [candidate division WOR-3 bacterium]|nr:7-cyano-7-deazaguanine synthase QueC [candidate division WOR-3 bacterium]
MKELAVVLVSGGVDSCVTAGIANKDYELVFLHINYGQRTEQKELDSFNKIADFYRVKQRLVCDFKWLHEIGGSSLTDLGMEVPVEQTHGSAPTTYVPFRNANLLGAGVSWAEVIGAKKIFIGVVAQDAPGYPDTSPEFIQTFNELIKLGTKPDTHIEVFAPIIDMQKYEVVKLGAKLNVPFRLTWSCYKNNERACGECESCKRRQNAFELAEINDLVPYENAKC